MAMRLQEDTPKLKEDQRPIAAPIEVPLIVPGRREQEARSTLGAAIAESSAEDSIPPPKQRYPATGFGNVASIVSACM